jgi:protein tyrosine/serine phosphatase
MKQVAENLFRGPRPSCFDWLDLAGVTRVIDLQSGTEDFFTESSYEIQDPKDFGIERFCLKWSNFFPPTKDQADTVMKLLNSGKKTYVHCHSGVDRTGAAILIYRVRMGSSFDDAYDEFVREGRHWWFFWWKPFLRRLSK